MTKDIFHVVAKDTKLKKRATKDTESKLMTKISVHNSSYIKKQRNTKEQSKLMDTLVTMATKGKKRAIEDTQADSSKRKVTDTCNDKLLIKDTNSEKAPNGSAELTMDTNNQNGSKDRLENGVTGNETKTSDIDNQETKDTCIDKLLIKDTSSNENVENGTLHIENMDIETPTDTVTNVENSCNTYSTEKKSDESISKSKDSSSGIAHSVDTMDSTEHGDKHISGDINENNKDSIHVTSPPPGDKPRPQFAQTVGSEPMTNESENEQVKENVVVNTNHRDDCDENEKESVVDLTAVENAKVDNDSEPLYSYLNNAMGQDKKERPVAAWVHRKDENTNILPRESKLNQAIRKIREKQQCNSPERAASPQRNKVNTVKATTWMPSIQGNSLDTTETPGKPVSTQEASSSHVKPANKSSSVQEASAPAHQKHSNNRGGSSNNSNSSSAIRSLCSPQKKHKGAAATPAAHQSPTSRHNSLLEQYCLKNMAAVVATRPPPLLPISSADTKITPTNIVTNTSKPFSISELTPSEIIVGDKKKLPNISSLEKLQELAQYHSKLAPGLKDSDSILQICGNGYPRSGGLPSSHSCGKNLSSGTSTSKTSASSSTPARSAMHIMPAQLQSTGSAVSRSFASHLAGLSRLAPVSSASSANAAIASAMRGMSQPVPTLGIPLSRSAGNSVIKPAAKHTSSKPVNPKAVKPSTSSSSKRSSASKPSSTHPLSAVAAAQKAHAAAMAAATGKAPDYGIYLPPTRPSPPVGLTSSPYPYESYMYTTGGVVMVGSQMKSPSHISQPYSPYARNSISTPSPSSLSPASPVSPGYRTGPTAAATGPSDIDPANNGYDAPLDFSSKKTEATPNPSRKPPATASAPPAPPAPSSSPERVLLKVPSLLRP